MTVTIIIRHCFTPRSELNTDHTRRKPFPSQIAGIYNKLANGINFTVRVTRLLRLGQISGREDVHGGMSYSLNFAHFIFWGISYAHRFFLVV